MSCPIGTQMALLEQCHPWGVLNWRQVRYHEKCPLFTIRNIETKKRKIQMQLWCWESNHGVWMVAFQMLLISGNFIMHSEFHVLILLLLYHYEEVGENAGILWCTIDEKAFSLFFQVCLGLSIYPFVVKISFTKYRNHLFSTTTHTTIPYKLTNKHTSPIYNTDYIYIACFGCIIHTGCTATIACHFCHPICILHAIFCICQFTREKYKRHSINVISSSASLAAPNLKTQHQCFIIINPNMAPNRD